MSRPEVILVEDERDVRLSYAQSLELAGFSVRPFAGAEGVLDLVGYSFPGILVSDIRMSGTDGMTLLSRVRAIDPDVPVILVTGHADTALAVAAMREGAYDFIEKPCSAQHLADVAGRALDRRRLVLENRRLRAIAGKRDEVETRLPGRAPAMVDLRYRIRALAGADADVLLVGGTGTGKEVAARALHDSSPRASRPFVVVDCAALPETLAASELFGHEAGAVPGAMRARFGKIEQAHGGTLLLDEIAAMPLDLQARVGRAIADRAVTRLGAHAPVPVDVRFIATARAEPEAEMAAGRLRADLFYRLSVATLRLPPLSARREDVPLLFLQLVGEAAARRGREEPEVPPAVIADVSARSWPGNVRELRNAADRYVLGLGLAPFGEGEAAGAGDSPSPRLADRVADYERSLIAGALALSGGNLRAVYEQLGISRKTLYEKMQKHGLDKRDYGLLVSGSDEADEPPGF